MKQIAISVDDAHAELYDLLREDGVKPRTVLEYGIRAKAGELGYQVEYVPASFSISKPDSNGATTEQGGMWYSIPPTAIQAVSSTHHTIMDMIAVLDADMYYGALDDMTHLQDHFRQIADTAGEPYDRDFYHSLANLLRDVYVWLSYAEIQPDGL